MLKIQYEILTRTEWTISDTNTKYFYYIYVQHEKYNIIYC